MGNTLASLAGIAGVFPGVHSAGRLNRRRGKKRITAPGARSESKG